MEIKTLIIGDFHIKNKIISELRDVVEEIAQIGRSSKINRIILLGDFFHSNYIMLNEIVFGIEIINTFLKITKDIIILRGNHGIKEKINITDFLMFIFKEIKIMDDFIDENDNYFGHFAVKESKKGWEFKKSITELKKYQKVFLGHCHNPQQIIENAWHLGSVLFLDWGQADEPKRRIMILNKDKVKTIYLKIPISMISAKTNEELEKLSPNVKVKRIYEGWNDIKNLEKWEKKFYDFTFTIESKFLPHTAVNKKFRSIKEIIDEKVKDTTIKNLLLKVLEDESKDN